MNVASYKNVDEESLLQIPGVVYVPMVGKVTVAMLERNLMRLYEQFHHPNASSSKNSNNNNNVVAHIETQQQKLIDIATTSLRLQVVTALAITTLLTIQLLRK